MYKETWNRNDFSWFTIMMGTFSRKVSVFRALKIGEDHL